MKKIRQSFRLHPDLLNQIQNHETKTGYNKTEIIELALQEYLVKKS